MDEDYIYTNQLWTNRDAMKKYYATRKFNLPDDFYDVLNDFSLLNDPKIVYIRETSSYVNKWQKEDLAPVFSKALGTDQGILFDLMKVAGAYNEIKEFKLVSDAQIEQLPAEFREFIREKNDVLSQLIEANKNKTGFTENDIAQVTDEDVVPFILSKFRGKPILLDFWETWCGPCRSANEAMKPMKTELAGKDIAYVYVATESSPLETWENMIPDLAGEHFRLSEKQGKYVKKTFGIEGVPTYFLIDREGHIKEKQLGFPGAEWMKGKLLQLVNE
jgi:thiol-disulfide isomerase/thioredoxin